MLAYYRALRPPIKAGPIVRNNPPVQIIWGAKDRFLGRPLMEASLARCELGSLTIIADGTHWLHHEHSDRISAAIANFCSD